ncbi:putative flippase GtrA [Microbacteriaceae bacterium SG_E_30_P1]|uniref:Flippase GtrA n=1 Tax=Antiquaquibacter oligotrophicus TaxID=2880260 RepID=A0ABT6KP07_9MICO|nr:GtrA family protein [Antiquaquibacter oligotrophicus]MDH6181730.1 putative flippase GtrA [Antiquaquibacter oligotrophicus]UDF12587.1 GtrA family protein [Antiquaquibacter oligotrophicus]
MTPADAPRERSAIGRLLHDHRVRFLAVGGTNTLVGYLVFTALTLWVFGQVPFGYLISLVLSYAVSITLAFWLYRTFVFVVKGRVLTDFVKFVGVNLVAIGVNAVLLPFFVEVVGLHPLVAQAISLVITTLVSYFGHKHVSFRRPSAPPQGDEGPVSR